MATEETKPVEREAFEDWSKWSGLAFHLAWEQERGYVDADTWKAFKTWQASAAAALERAAQEADKWANSASCDDHDDNPCCHVRTGAGIADAIRALKGSR